MAVIFKFMPWLLVAELPVLYAQGLGGPQSPGERTFLPGTEPRQLSTLPGVFPYLYYNILRSKMNTAALSV
jgi:hypothetical protein